MAVAITHSKVSAVADGSDATPVRPSDWNANHVIPSRTRTIPLIAQAPSSSVYVGDTHGTIVSISHFDVPDAVAYVYEFANVPTPIDFTGGLTFCMSFSTSVGGNNVEMRHLLQCFTPSGVTAPTSRLDTGDTQRAADAVADKTAVLRIASTTQPAVGDIIAPTLVFSRNLAGDNNTGILSVWAVWLEYTADI